MVGYLAVAVVLGVLADLGLHLGERAGVLFTVGTPWVVLAFGAGRAGPPRWSALAGGVTLLVGLAAYYLWLLLGMQVSLDVLTGSGYRGLAWLAAGALVGAVAGATGGLTRSPRRLPADTAWCGVTAVPLAEGIIALGYGVAPPVLTTASLGAAALALLVWARRSGARAWALVVGVPLATLVLWALELVVLQQVFGRLTWI